MILSGRAIQKHIGSDIIIEPYDPKRVNPNSYNLSLHNELLVYTGNTLDMKQANPTECIVIPEEGLVLEPNRLYLGRTNEYTKTERYVHAGGALLHGTTGPVYPRDGRVRRYRLCGLLDAGDFLHPAGAYLPGCGDLPDLLPRYRRGFRPVCKREIPEQYGHSASLMYRDFERMNDEMKSLRQQITRNAPPLLAWR